MQDDLSAASLRDELQRRGLRTALEELEDDGPSAFKDPEKVIEYVMLNLQHNKAGGITEAFRFTSSPAGRVSFVSGSPMSSERISWRKGTVIEGYVSGGALSFEAFQAELLECYSLLLGCQSWRFAVLHPQTFAPLARKGDNDFAREYLLSVDGTAVAVRLIYDWGSWCYLLYSVGERQTLRRCAAPPSPAARPLPVPQSLNPQALHSAQRLWTGRRLRKWPGRRPSLTADNSGTTASGPPRRRVADLFDSGGEPDAPRGGESSSAVVCSVAHDLCRFAVHIKRGTLWHTNNKTENKTRARHLASLPLVCRTTAIRHP